MASFKVVKPYRSSTFTVLKNERFIGLKDLPAPAPYSSGLSVSAQWVASPFGSRSNLTILPVDYSQYKRVNSPFVISASSGDVSDFMFSPHSDSLLASADSNGMVKLWQIPAEGLTASMNAPLSKVEDNLDSIHCIRFHPSASNVMCVGSKSGVSIVDWSAEKVANKFPTEGFGKDSVSLAWSRDGSLIAALGKNNNITAFDPRSADTNLLAAGGLTTPSMKKTHSVLFVGGESSQSSQLVLFGLSSGQRPLVQFFDPRSLAAPLIEKDLEFSNGVVMPLYDIDTNQLFLTVRGSNMIQLFDVEQDKGKSNQHFCGSFSCENSIRGWALTGKRGINTNEAEINRIFVLGTDTVEPVSVRVPRKAAGFHEDLYPATAGLDAALNSSEYFAGQNATPKMISMVDHHFTRGGVKVAVLDKFDPMKTVAALAQKITIDDDEEDKKSSEANPTNRPKSTSNASSKFVYNSATRERIDSKLRTSIYRHTSCREPPSIHETHYDIKLGASLPLAENIRANTRYFVVPWAVSGGSGLAVFELGKVGRTPVKNFPFVKGHKSPATTFDLSCRPGFEQFLVSASVDGDIRLYELPEGSLTKDVMEEKLLMTVDGKVTVARFHPFIDHVLVSATSAFGEHAIDFWDLRTGEKKISMNNLGHSDVILDISFHGSGHLIATTCKDGKARIINVATKTLVKEFAVPEGVRETRIVWAGNNAVVTIGFSTGMMRSVSYWNLDGDCTKPTCQLELDKINNVPIARFDEDSKLLLVGNYGSTFINSIQVRSDSPQLELLDTMATKSDCAGFIFLPKSCVDEGKAEIIKSLKLTKDAVHTLSHAVPRKRIEFFQDDLYPNTRDLSVSLMTPEAFFNGENPNGVEPVMRTMNRRGLQMLSSAPEEELTERQLRYQKMNEVKEEPKPVGPLGYKDAEEIRTHFVEIAKHVTGNRWDAKPDHSRVDVDEDEWN